MICKVFSAYPGVLEKYFLKKTFPLRLKIRHCHSLLQGMSMLYDHYREGILRRHKISPLISSVFYDIGYSMKQGVKE